MLSPFLPRLFCSVLALVARSTKLAHVKYTITQVTSVYYYCTTLVLFHEPQQKQQ